MATRAASAAPIQRVLRESGIQDPLPLANRNLNSVITTLNPCYSRVKEGSVECGISLARDSRRGEEGFI
jgi:hypothetical protein